MRASLGSAFTALALVACSSTSTSPGPGQDASAVPPDASFDASPWVACSGSEVDCGGKSCGTTGDGLDNCGLAMKDSCCASPLVVGGPYIHDYDGATRTNDNFANRSTVSSFRLEKYEVTVGRFRKFVDAWDGGWRPAAGAGKHRHLRGGQGLALCAKPGSESGWDAAWSALPPSTKSAWDSNLTAAVGPPSTTWTPTAGANERLPITNVSWYEAYAFCIWDDGFLPTEGEWAYAAQGGNEQRVYPWSSPPTSTTVDGTRWAGLVDGGCSLMPPAGGGSPGGAGKYGQLDLAGSVAEWELDDFSTATASPDCAYFFPGIFVQHGGNTCKPSMNLDFQTSRPDERSVPVKGIRCARAP